jgi:hypothetical protein
VHVSRGRNSRICSASVDFAFPDATEAPLCSVLTLSSQGWADYSEHRHYGGSGAETKFEKSQLLGFWTFSAILNAGATSGF